MNQLLLAIILSILPITELRAGLPVAVDYALKNNISIIPIFFLIILVNIAVIFLVFFFLDFFHKWFLKINIYKRVFGYFVERTRKKAESVKEKMSVYGFLALAIFVAIPLPATGAWTGCLIAWLLGLDRKKSIAAIGLGVIVAGIIILIASLGVFGLIGLF